MIYLMYPCNLYQDISLSNNVPKLFDSQPTNHDFFFWGGGGVICKIGFNILVPMQYHICVYMKHGYNE